MDKSGLDASNNMATAETPELKGYVARPGVEGPVPGIILIHEFWGINDNIREFAREFAAKGYFGLAVDLYEGRVTDEAEEARAWAGEVKADPDRALANIRQAIDYLKQRPEVAGEKIAIVGFCFGGGWAYRAALAFDDLEAAVIYYGGVDPADDFSGLKPAMLGHFGEQDPAIKADKVRAFKAALSKAGPQHEIYLYPFAGHAFARKGGKNYNPPAAQLAWHRTLAFLDKHL